MDGRGGGVCRWLKGAGMSQGCSVMSEAVDCSPPGSSVHKDSPGKNTGMGCYFLLQGIFRPRDRTRVSYVSCIGRQVLHH